MTGTERTYGERLPTGRRSRVAEPRTGWPLLVAGLLTAVAGAGPWVAVDKLHVVRSGLQEGPLIFALGVIVAVCGLLVARRLGSTPVLVAALVLSIIASVLTLLGLASAKLDVSKRYEGVSPTDVDVEWGYYGALLFTLVCCAAAVLAFLRRDSVPRD